MPEIEDLSTYLANAGQPERFVDTTAEFTINNDDEALWAMRRLAQAQRHVAAVKRQAQVEIDRIETWVEMNVSSERGTIDFFESALSDYLIRVRQDESDGRKSITFPDGIIKSSTTQPKVTVLDQELFLAWAQANGRDHWIRTTYTPDVSTLKKVVDFAGDGVLDPLTGEKIAGLQHTEGGVAVNIKVTE
jgi:phage host-nuclease inhibitor protein Gam